MSDEFFKAIAARTVGNGNTVYIRRDSTWNVPKLELTLFCCSEGTIEGYSIGNDMSSRSIEGENPFALQDDNPLGIWRLVDRELKK